MDLCFLYTVNPQISPRGLTYFLYFWIGAFSKGVGLIRGAGLVKLL